MKKIKAGVRPKTDGRKAPRTYPVEKLSRKYCAFRGWKPAAERYQKTGRKGPKEGQFYLSGGYACVASFDLDDTPFEILKPVREVPRAKRPVARRAKGAKS